MNSTKLVMEIEIAQNINLNNFYLNENFFWLILKKLFLGFFENNVWKCKKSCNFFPASGFWICCSMKQIGTTYGAKTDYIFFFPRRNLFLPVYKSNIDMKPRIITQTSPPPYKHEGWGIPASVI